MQSQQTSLKESFGQPVCRMVTTSSHIACTDQRPDRVWWDEAKTAVTLLELTILFTPFWRRQL